MYHNVRRSGFIGRALTLLAAVGVLLATQGAAAAPAVLGVRTGEQPSATRFVLDLSEALEYRVFVLPNPYRVVIDLPEVDWLVEPTAAVAQGLIRNFRFGLFEAGTSRVVLDVAQPVRIRRSFLLPPNGSFPHRFVLDIEAVDADAFEKVAALPPRPRRQRRVPASKPLQKGGDARPTVIIDPGHGGIDPGTIGRKGTLEKHVTLRVAKELERQLTRSGRYHVRLTREKDIFVRLRDRVAFARREGGDLFISLHADSIKNRNVRGAAAYTLSEKASDSQAAALAAKENRADVIAGIDLNGESSEVTTILIDLARRETMNLSAGFASLVLPEIQKNGNVLRNDHRVAGFAVLKAPDIPSILIEMGYLSNRRDEKLLLSKSYHRDMSTAIFRAIERYFSEVKR